MGNMYEHHAPGTIVALAGFVYLQYMDVEEEEEPGLLAKLLPLPLAVTLSAHVCEIFCVIRTFMPHPDGPFCKITQQILVILLITCESTVGIHTVLAKYLHERISNPSELHPSELVIVPMFFYLNCFVQPVYAWKNMQGLARNVKGLGK